MNDKPKLKSNDFLILSVRLHSGRMESSVQVPLDVDADQRERLIAAWVRMMQECVSAAKPEEPAI